MYRKGKTKRFEWKLFHRKPRNWIMQNKILDYQY
jgi:hypothetical protein